MRPHGLQIKSLKILFIGCLFISFFSVKAYAISYRQITAEKMFDASLNSLRESANELAEKNDLILTEIERFYRDIQKMEQELKVLKDKKESYLYNSPVSPEEDLWSQDMPIFENNLDRIKNDILNLNTERRRLEQSLAGKQREEQAIQRQIQMLEGEVKGVQRQIKSQYNVGESREYQMRREQLLRMIEVSGNELRWRQEDAKNAQKNYAGPLETIAKLRETKAALKKDVAAAEASLNVAEEERKHLQELIVDLSKNKGQQAEELGGEIKALQARNEELQYILSRAGKKIDKDTMGVYSDQKLNELAQNLNFIKHENQGLTERIKSLEQSLQELKSQ